jgi:23S rRNA (guanosine2251-2'-O)-methyltransferase
LPICREKDLKKTIQVLHDNGIRVVACTEKTERNLYEINLTGPIALIVGSEEDGISDALLRTADELARLPMKGKIGSLNVSVAAGIALYEVVRQKGNSLT